MSDPVQSERLAVAFTRLARRSGLPIPGDAATTYAQALAAVGFERPGPVYWAGRATLVRRPEDAEVYDRVFEAFWLDRFQLALGSPATEPLTLVLDEAEEEGDSGTDDLADEGGERIHVRYSPVETLREKDFATCSPDELIELRRLLESVRLAGPRRRTRRMRPARRGSRDDLRRTVRRSMRTGGEPIRRAWRDRAERPRRVVLLCDVSGSMEPYARVLLRFLHAGVSGGRDVEAFTFGTRLTRVTRELALHDPDAALARAAETVPDWSGGTRLGEVLRQFNDRWGVRGLARGAVVVILSDGWDRGDPEVLATEMARLARVAHEIVWVNPLKATPGYAPLARGIAAALPFVDRFVEGHSLASLEALAEVVGSS